MKLLINSIRRPLPFEIDLRPKFNIIKQRRRVYNRYPLKREICYYPEFLKKIKNKSLFLYDQKNTLSFLFQIIRILCFFYMIEQVLELNMLYISSFYTFIDFFFSFINVFSMAFFVRSFINFGKFDDEKNRIRFYSLSLIIFQFVQKLAYSNNCYNIFILISFLSDILILFFLSYHLNKVVPGITGNRSENSLSAFLIRYVSGFTVFEMFLKSITGFFIEKNNERLVNFSFFSKDWATFVFFKGKENFFLIESQANAIIFQTALVYLLMLLYFIAFDTKQSHKDFRKDIEYSKNDEKLYQKNLIKKNRDFSEKPNEIFLKNFDKKNNKLADLLEEEQVSISRNCLWKIKKVGINVPFIKILWNNETSVAKQGLWYEIKKKKN
jgi:hypothetical protein